MRSLRALISAICELDQKRVQMTTLYLSYRNTGNTPMRGSICMTVYSLVVGHLDRKAIGCGVGLGREAVMKWDKSNSTDCRKYTKIGSFGDC